VKVHHTPTGEGLIVLPPPLVAAGDQLFWRSGNPDNNGLDPVPAVGGVVDGDVEGPCPAACDEDCEATCHQHHLPTWKRTPCDHGTVSVPHVVRDVRRILAWDNDPQDIRGRDASGYLRIGESRVWFYWSTTIPSKRWLVESVDRADLPGAEPGGVALVVERAT
jgi:hypothetical protein